MKKTRITFVSLAVFMCALMLCACAGGGNSGTDIDVPQKTEAPQSGEIQEQTQKREGGICVLLSDASSASSLRMALGAQEYAAFSGMDITVRGTENTQDAEFASLIEQALSDAPRAVCIAFPGGEQTELALEKAQSAGVKVIACGPTELKNADAVILPAENAVIGAAVMDALADNMQEKGGYAVAVPSKEDETANETALGALEHQRQVYQDMEALSGNDPFYCGSGSDEVYQAMTALMKEEDAPRGIIMTSEAATQGAAMAVSELDAEDRPFICGIGNAEQNAALLQNGFVSALVGSDPSLDIQAACSLARLLLEGGTPGEHTDLGVIGYNDVNPVSGTEKVFAGNSITTAVSESAAQ